MQVTEQLAEGLKREIKIVVPADDMRGRLDEKLDDAKSKVRLKGFRPGKVPAAHLKNMYGRSMMAEIVDDIIKSSSRDIPAERGEKAAMAPQITMTEDEGEANEMLAGAKDFEFSLAYEILPSIDIKDFSKIEIVRPVVEIGDEEVMEQVEKVAENARPYESKDGAAKEKDRLTMDYIGKVDGEAFEGGTDTGAQIVLGSGSFIPGFEEQLSGAKKGEDKTVKVTFPDDYPAAHLAGKNAVFEVSVKDVEKPGKLTFDDALAEKLGLESFDRLKTVVREQIESQFGQHTRQKVKRQILDALDEEYQFDTPEKLVEAEFDNIWRQVTHDLEHAGKTFADEDTTEEEAREEYRKLAERRVRLGLVLSEIGTQAEIKVGDEEMERAVYEQVRRYPGQEKEVFEFLKGNPEALAGIRAPLFEEKVIDHLMAGMKVKDKTVSKDELMADDEEDTAPVKKTAKSKAAGKASSSKSDKDGSDKKESKAAKKPAVTK